MDTNKSRAVGQSLRALRLKSNLTQVELSKELGKPQSYVSKLETGERGLYVYEIVSLAKALNISTHTIIDTIEAKLAETGGQA